MTKETKQPELTPEQQAQAEAIKAQQEHVKMLEGKLDEVLAVVDGLSVAEIREVTRVVNVKAESMTFNNESNS